MRDERYAARDERSGIRDRPCLPRGMGRAHTWTMRKLVPPLVLVAVWGFTFAVFDHLPPEIATHWNLWGEPDGWSSRALGATMLPAILTAMFVLFTWFVPRVDPRGESYAAFQATYDILVAATLAALGAVHVVVLGVALGWDVTIARAVPLVVGALFVVIGILMPRVRPNWFIGIRTPWTLSSDRVWERSHRVGGPLLVLGGLCIAASALARGEWSLALMLAGVIGSSLAAIGYSYWAWRQESRRAGDDGSR